MITIMTSGSMAKISDDEFVFCYIYIMNNYVKIRNKIIEDNDFIIIFSR